MRSYSTETAFTRHKHAKYSLQKKVKSRRRDFRKAHELQADSRRIRSGARDKQDRVSAVSWHGP